MIQRVVKIAAFSVAFAVIAGISAYLTITFLIKGEDTVIVPDLNGKEVVYVLKILTDLGLNTKVGGSQHHDTIPMNHVIYQEPQPGTEIKRGRDIRIIISKGTQKVQTPNLNGLSAQQAKLILAQKGLCPGKESRAYSDRTRKDEIIAQFPLPGLKINRDMCVDLLISDGIRPQNYKMPDLVGKSVEEAILLIERMHLKLGDIKPVTVTDKPVNVVVSQEPESGGRVFEGINVNLEANIKRLAISEKSFEGAGGVRLFRYRHQHGFLNKRIVIKIDWFGNLTDIYDDFVAPGRDVWVLIPKNQDVTVSVYANDEFVEYHAYTAWHNEVN